LRGGFQATPQRLALTRFVEFGQHRLVGLRLLLMSTTSTTPPSPAESLTSMSSASWPRVMLM
jgi:hypothetical protein